MRSSFIFYIHSCYHTIGIDQKIFLKETNYTNSVTRILVVKITPKPEEIKVFPKSITIFALGLIGQCFQSIHIVAFVSVIIIDQHCFWWFSQ